MKKPITQNIQKMSKMVKKKSLKISNNSFFLQKCENFKNIFFCNKKFYPLSFLLLGGRDSTRALQSSPFQNPGGGSFEPDGNYCV